MAKTTMAEFMMKSMLDVVTGNCPSGYKDRYTPEKIMKSGNATIFFWKDGTKTVVKLPEGETPDDYAVFVHALGKKMFGSRNALKKVLEDVEVQEMKKGDKDAVLPTSTESIEGNGTI